MTIVKCEKKKSKLFGWMLFFAIKYPFIVKKKKLNSKHKT